MNFIVIALVLSALYSGGAYLYVFFAAVLASSRRHISWAESCQIELNTFHLGLCFILSLGFLGLILGRG